MTLLKSHVHGIKVAVQFLLFCLFCTASLAQSGGSVKGKGIIIEKTNWSGTMECFTEQGMPPAPDPDTLQCVQLWSDNVLLFKLIARVGFPDVNLCDPMYFYYFIPNNFSVGGPNQGVPNAPGNPFHGIVGPVTNDMLESITLEDGSEGWQAVFPFYIDFSDECNLQGAPEQFYFEIQYQLAQLHPQNWSPYSPMSCPDLFPPHIFHAPPITDLQIEGKYICCYDGSYPCDPPNLMANDNNSDYLDGIQLGEFSQTQNNVTHQPSVLSYPNPFSDEMSFAFENLPANEPVDLTIFNVHGKKIKEFSWGENQSDTFMESINTSDFPPGIYYFRFLAGDEELVTKSVKY